MKRVFAVVVFLVLILGSSASVSLASWVSNNCSKDNLPDQYVKRLEAQAYSIVADDEGYEWGGGCWNDNNKDDSPNQTDSDGEGPDCSGFTFKTWELVNGLGKSGFTWYNKLENIHGPYGSWSFYAPASNYPFYTISKDRAVMMYMDAFAKNGHVAMLYTTANPSANTDWVIEALGESYGTDKNEQGYRYQSEYVGVRRKDWTPDCWPQCQTNGDSPFVVVVP